MISLSRKTDENEVPVKPDPHANLRSAPPVAVNPCESNYPGPIIIIPNSHASVWSMDSSTSRVSCVVHPEPGRSLKVPQLQEEINNSHSLAPIFRPVDGTFLRPVDGLPLAEFVARVECCSGSPYRLCAKVI